jgi:predicted PurR-regulated permease PerM
VGLCAILVGLCVTTASFSQLQRFFYVLGTLVLVVLSLYFARLVLVPLAAAILITFILSPLVGLLQSNGCARFLAIILVAGGVFIILALLFAMIIGEFNNLARDIPQYQSLIVEKIKTLQSVSEGSVAKNLLNLFKEVSKDLTGTRDGLQDQKGPIPVTVESSFLPVIQSILGSMLDFLVNVGLVLLLVIFMLHQREELRNRVLRLIGTGNLSGTIKTLDDAGQRVSRFLQMQFIINLTFGTCIGIGLFCVGVPYAFLWGFLGTLLRYIPYLGPWLGAFFPLLLSWAMFSSWVPFFVVLGLFVILEVTLSNFVEPWLYGRSIGVSEVALLLFAVFWAWLWGPLGLIMATPLTAVLVVFARHFPQLEFFALLLGDQPAFDPPLAFFHRLLANDQDEAAEIVEGYVEEHGLEEVYARIIVAALTSLDKEREQGKLSSEEQVRFLQAAREILHEVVFPVQRAFWAHEQGQSEDDGAASRTVVFGVPTHAEDELVLEMFKEYLDPRKFQVTILSDHMLFAEILGKIKQESPPFIVISCLPSAQSARCRFLCKKTRREIPNAKLFVGYWGLETLSDQLIQRFKTSGADFVGLTFADIAHQLGAHHPIVAGTNGKEPSAKEQSFVPACAK